MITLRPAAERGHADHGWLKTNFTFSFAEYFDPEHMQFGPLRVLNQDRIAAGTGFPTHPHRDMEIVTVVLEGKLAHKDSMGVEAFLVPGDVQAMSAGSGITHSEYNGSQDDPLHLIQMWVLPRTQGATPRYSEKHYPLADRQDRWQLVVDPEERDGALPIDQDARLLVARLAPGKTLEHALAPGRRAWLHVASGAVQLGEQRLADGDGAAIEGEMIRLTGEQPAELLLWDLG